jgi:hypothetical protein
VNTNGPSTAGGVVAAPAFGAQPERLCTGPYTPEEARMAEQYARDAMADAAASDDRHYRSH